MRFEHTTEISAPAEVVWDLTVDLEGWPATTPTMTSVERLDAGPVRPGSTARIRQPVQRPRVWTVTEVAPPTTFVWSTRALGVAMVATHRIQPAGEGRCRLSLVLDLEGRGAGVVGRLVGGQLRRALATEADGFRAAAEARAGTPAG